MKFKKPNKPTFQWDTGIKGWVYSGSEDFLNASGVYFEVTGRHGKIKTTSSDRVYFVVSGNGEFIINDNSIKVRKHDMVIIPKNTPYDYKASDGKILKFFLVHTPAFDQEREISLEKDSL